MAQFIESLESRRLLSGTGALAVIQADAKALSADVKALGKTEAANLKVVQADVKASANASAGKAALKTLTAGSKSGVAVLSKQTAKSLALVKKDVTKGTAIVKQLLKKPANAALEAKLSAAIQTLNTDAGNGQSSIAADITALNTTDSANIASLQAVDVGDAKLTTDLSAGASSNSAAQAAVNTAANTTLTTDVAAIIAQANAVV